MKVLRLHGIKDLRLAEEPKPSPRAGQELVKISSVGVCGSDIHWFADGSTGDGSITQPFVLGHEFSGVVEGGSMDGVRVAVEPNVPCGQCEFCLEGNPNLCPYHYFAGQAPQDGALQEYLAWPKTCLFPVPDSINDEETALLEPLGVALHTINLGNLQPGMTVGVFGCGPIGLLIVQLARLSGVSKIIATDLLSHRLDAAAVFGADRTILADQSEESGEVLSLTKGRGLDVTFEAAGDNDAVITAIQTCKPGGRVVLCGIPATNETRFPASAARRKGLTILIVRRMKHTYPRAIALASTGKIDLRSLISHRFPLEKAADAFQAAYDRDGLKVVVNL